MYLPMLVDITFNLIISININKLLIFLIEIVSMTYHRKESPTQSVKVAALQEQSLEVWGKEPRNSDMLKVQAFKRRLPTVTRGIEFNSHVDPDPDGHPHIACWSGDRPGMLERQDENGHYAAINVFDFKNEQPPLLDGETWQLA